MLCIIRCAKTTPDHIPLILIVTGDFVDMYESLEQAAQPFLGLLKQGGHIPRNQHFTAFTPDVTRFILKQHEKSRSDSPAEGVYGNMLQTRLNFVGEIRIFSLKICINPILHLCIDVSYKRSRDSYRDAVCTKIATLCNKNRQPSANNQNRSFNRPPWETKCPVFRKFSGKS